MSYRSVIVFGHIHEIADVDQVARFYRAFMAKYAPADSWNRDIGPFPRAGRMIVHAIVPKTITGKERPLPSAGE